MMKNLLLTFSIALLSLSGFAQIGAGVNLGLLRYPEADESFLTYGLHGMYGGLSEKVSLRLMFHTGAFKDSFSFSSFDETTNLSVTTDVESRFRLSILSGEILYNLGSGSMEEGGLYVGAGVGLGFANNKLEATGPQANELSGTDSVSQIFFKGAFGYSYVLDSGIGIFGEGFVHFPPNANSEGEAIEISLAGNLGLHFGVRKHF
jgi:hypothetical protein